MSVINDDDIKFPFRDLTTLWGNDADGYGGRLRIVTDTLDDDLMVAVDTAGRVVFKVASDGAFVPKETRPRFGAERLRETRQRLMCRRLGESRQLTIATIGDSYTHNYSRWTGPSATYLMGQFGDAGGGWVGFANLGGTLPNGNVRPASYTYATSGTWDLSAYYTSVGPDIGQVTSASAGAKITLAGPATPVLSAATLFWVGTSAGVVQYRWNGGSWHTLNVQGGVGVLGTADLSSDMPSSGAWTLEIEVVSGTVSLCGTSLKSAASGVAWHKLGASGSQAQHWAAQSSLYEWRKGLAALAPDLVEIMLGTNDQGAARTPAQFAADLSVLIDNCRWARPTADVLVMMPPENQRTTNATSMARYADVAAHVARAQGAAFCDAQPYFGELPVDYAYGSARPWFASDNVHPDPATGGRALVAAFLDSILHP